MLAVVCRPHQQARLGAAGVGGPEPAHPPRMMNADPLHFLHGVCCPNLFADLILFSTEAA